MPEPAEKIISGDAESCPREVMKRRAMNLERCTEPFRSPGTRMAVLIWLIRRGATC